MEEMKRNEKRSYMDTHYTRDVLRVKVCVGGRGEREEERSVRYVRKSGGEWRENVRKEYVEEFRKGRRKEFEGNGETRLAGNSVREEGEEDRICKGRGKDM